MREIINIKDIKNMLSQQIPEGGILDLDNAIRWKAIITEKVKEITQMNDWGLEISEESGALSADITLGIPENIIDLCGILSVAETAHICKAEEEGKAVISITYNFVMQ